MDHTDASLLARLQEHAHDLARGATVSVELLTDLELAAAALRRSGEALRRLQAENEDGWRLLNAVAEAIGISDGSGEWDRTELLETAQVCNADDFHALKTENQELRARAALEKAEAGGRSQPLPPID